MHDTGIQSYVITKKNVEGKTQIWFRVSLL